MRPGARAHCGCHLLVPGRPAALRGGRGGGGGSVTVSLAAQILVHPVLTAAQWQISKEHIFC